MRASHRKAGHVQEADPADGQRHRQASRVREGAGRGGFRWPCIAFWAGEATGTLRVGSLEEVRSRPHGVKNIRAALLGCLLS